MSWREWEYIYTPAITEDELWKLPDLSLCKTQWIIFRAANAPLMIEHAPMFDIEEGVCTHFDEIIVTESPIESNLIMLQYPPSICHPQWGEKEYSPYFFDFVDWKHMKLIIETGHNWILRYGDKVDEYDVPECTLENIHIRTFGHACDYPDNAEEDFCQEYLKEKRASETVQSEKQIVLTQWVHVFQNSFVFRISFILWILLLLVCIRKILQKRKKHSQK